MEAYTSARETFNEDAKVFLDANENPYGNYNRYPDPYQKELKELIASRKNVASHQIFLGNGSDEIIDLLIRIFCQPQKDLALGLSPSYGMYKVSCDINDVGLIEIPLNKNLNFDWCAFEETNIKNKAKLFFLCSPNNPTGISISVAELEAILNTFNGIVVVDEAYIDFSTKESALALLKDYNNLVVLQTLSKSAGMAALRIGIAYSSNQIIELLNKVKSPYNISSLNQRTAVKQLLNQSVISKNIERIVLQRAKMKLDLEALNCTVKVYPSDANFLLVEVKDANDIYTKLLKRGIVTRNRNDLIPNCLRISIGTEQENNLLINELKNYCNEEATIY